MAGPMPVQKLHLDGRTRRYADMGRWLARATWITSPTDPKLHPYGMISWTGVLPRPGSGPLQSFAVSSASGRTVLLSCSFL